MIDAESDLDTLTRFHGLRKMRPSKSALENSALAWLALAQTQVGVVRALAQFGDRIDDTDAALDTLRSQLGHVSGALTESESLECMALRKRLSAAENELARTRRLLGDERAERELRDNPGTDIPFADGAR